MNKQELELFDRILSGQLDIFRLAARKRAEVLRRLARMEKELVEKLATGDFKRGQRRKFARFLKEADEIIKRHYSQALLDLDLPKISETIAQVTANDLSVVLGPIAPDVKLPTVDFHAAVASEGMTNGVPQAEWWARQTASTQQAFAAALRQGLASNETNQQLIKRVMGDRGVGGVMNLARHQAAALVQTGVSSVANTARLESFRKNSDIVLGVRQVSTLDSHTSDVCIAYSGQAWDLEGKPIRGTTLAFNGGPPRHFNCRSVLVPILKTFRQLGLDVDEVKGTTRASDEGQIAASTTFDSFLKRKSQAYQDEVLGVGRADLWRDGKISLRDLVSGDGRPLTLEQLRAKAGVSDKPETEFMTPKDIEARDIVLGLGRKPKVEYLLAYHAGTGSFVSAPVKGSKSGVSYNDKLRALLADPSQSIIAHHNHPSSSSLSPADVLEVASKPGLKALWAHGHNGSSYKAELGEAKLEKHHIEGVTKTLNSRFNNLLRLGEVIEVDDINSAYFHMVNVILDKKKLMRYSYKLEGEQLSAFERLKPHFEKLLEELEP